MKFEQGGMKFEQGGMKFEQGGMKFEHGGMMLKPVPIFRTLLGERSTLLIPSLPSIFSKHLTEDATFADLIRAIDASISNLRTQIWPPR